MVWQRARELGAISSGLVRPGEVFDWPTLQPWADEVQQDEAKVELAANVEAPAPASLSGFAVTPGRSETVKPDTQPRRGRRPGKAETI
jgi:hypothetical protein